MMIPKHMLKALIALALSIGAHGAVLADEIDIRGSWQINLDCGNPATGSFFLEIDEDLGTAGQAAWVSEYVLGATVLPPTTTTTTTLRGAAICKDAKAKAAGEKALALLKAHGRDEKRPDPARLAVDVSKAQSKFTKAFSNAEVGGECQTSGDAPTIGAKVDAFVADAVLEICPVCGDGIKVLAEDCDDGNTQDGDCCDSNCRFEPYGAPCEGDGNECSVGAQCNGSGTCGGSACCVPGLDLFSFEMGMGSGNCGVLSNFRCSNKSGAACAENGDCDFGTCLITPPICSGDFSTFCNDDSDCQGTCKEIIAGNLPVDLECGGLYLGGGLNPIPLPWVTADKSRALFAVSSCDSETGVLTLGPTTPAEVGEDHCTSGRECSVAGTPCVLNSDCPSGESCNTRCLFGAPMPKPWVVSLCGVTHVGGDVSGTVQCNGGDAEVKIPLRLVLYFNGDLLTASTPPDIPGIQPCPLCDYLCEGGAKDRFPCDDDSECPGGSCGTATQCLGGPNDGAPCTPGTSDSQTLGDSENAYPTSHDCGNDPLQDITANIGGLPITFELTTGRVVVNGIDHSHSARTFFGFCEDVAIEGSLCFEGDTDARCPAAVPPATGEAVPCDEDADCNDGDAYESCSQRNPGAFSEVATTSISVAGSTDGQCLADGDLHPSKLVGVFGVQPSFDMTLDAMLDLPGPGAAMLQGQVRLE